MPKVEGVYPHTMSKEDAVEASKKAITKLLAAFEATDTIVSSDGEDNVGFSCKSRGFFITGKVLIKENEVDATVTLPMMAIAFKGLVKSAMDKHIPKHMEEVNE